MLSQIFLGMSLMGAEWVLYLLIILSILSVAVIFERVTFYRSADRQLAIFRAAIRKAAMDGKWDEIKKISYERIEAQKGRAADLEVMMVLDLASNPLAAKVDILSEIAHDSVARSRLHWERNLAILATIGSNAPFVGLFGTVLGIIKAFHDLSQQAGAGAQVVTGGIAEALVATAVGILVAVPAVVAYNIFQRRVRAAISEADALKSFLIGKLAK